MDIPTPHTADRGLRAISVMTFPFALVILLIHGITAHKLCPALGLIPMTFSALVGILVYINKLKSPLLRCALDIFIAAFLFGILMPSWIILSEDWQGRSTIMLGTYGTMPLMFNFAIHAFLGLRELFALISAPRRCPHCHNELNPRASGGNGGISIGQTYRNRLSFMGGGVGHSRSSKEIYQPLAPSQYDDDARESSEIETTPRPSAETLRSSAAGSSKSVENLV